MGEVVLASGQLREANRLGTSGDPPHLAAGLDHMDRVLGDLERRARDLRTAPLLRVTEKLPRLARELGLALGRKVALELVGSQLELDRAILDRLADPLLHLVRNAVAHGIEAPAERRRAGKAEQGHIVVEARRERDFVLLAVGDDGAGIDVEALRRCAVAAGLVPADLADDLPPSDVARLAFRPGMTTAANVSEIAGRGVGLDAVRATVESLGGSVDLVSERGRGTTIRLRVPLSAAMQRVILIGVGEERVAIPIGRVDRIVDVESQHVERAGGESFVLIDGLPLPYLELAELVGLRAATLGTRILVLLAEVHGQRTALRFDRLLGQAEVFVKSVPRLLLGVPTLSGLTLDTAGRPVFLVEPGRFS